jgi:hypothetical protein
LVFEGTTYQSGGPANPWDHDVNDVLALITVVAATIPEAIDRTRDFLSRLASLMIAIQSP